MRWRTESSKGSGGLLSRRWVQTFVFELPDLKASELNTSLRYKVQATLPVNTDEFVFHSQLLRHQKKKYGVAFLSPPAITKEFQGVTPTLRVGVPLVLSMAFSPQTLLFIATPEGLSPHLYENHVLKASFAPLDPKDESLREKLTRQYSSSEIIGFCPDPDFPLPPDLRQVQPREALQASLMKALPLWDPPPPSRLPAWGGSFLAVSGLILIGLAMMNSWSYRQERNEAWRNWLKQNENVTATPQDKTPILLKAQGAPVPELFVHLADAWGDQTKILNLQWNQNKLTLTAQSPSALASLRKLTADPWFRSIKVVEIRTQKDGGEAFTIEGGLSLDN